MTVPAPAGLAAAAAAPAAFPAAAPKPATISAAEAIAAMAAAVQRGDFAGAEALGAAAEVHLALPKHALHSLRPLSQGAQATVFAAQLAADCAHLLPVLQPDAYGRVEVAVKRAHIRDSADLDRFRREAALLAQLQHPHIVRLLGARLLPPGYQLVLQLEASNAAAELHGAGWRPSWPVVLALGAQLATAVAHMHNNGYVHRDIKPANVLLCEQRKHARLADLGLATSAAELEAGGVAAAKPTGGFHKQRMVGTLEYMAPEVLLASHHSYASDVFALAITLNEMATGTVPYSDCTRDNPLAHTVLEMGYGRQELAAAVAAEGLRPFKRPDTPVELERLLDACWARQPGERPSAAQVAAALQAMAADAATQEEEDCGAAAAGAAGEGCSVEEASEEAAVPAAVAAAGKAGNAASPFGLQTPPKQAGAPRRPAADSPAPAGRKSLYGEGSADGDADMAEAEEAPPPAAPAAGASSSQPPAWLAVDSGNGASSSSSLASDGQQGVAAAAGATATGPSVFAGTFLTAGKRDKMEDTVAVLQDAFRTAGAPGCTALGVFDGHRGAAAAEFLASNLRQLLAARLPGSASAADLLSSTLADADVAFRAQQDADWAQRVGRMGAAAAGAQPAPGSTATVLLVYPGWGAGQAEDGGMDCGLEEQQAQQQQYSEQYRRQMLAVANLGDSRVVLCRGGQALQLTRDHTADSPDERRRVEAAGGACSVRAGGWRVGATGLQVTRSIGDADLKGQGVTAEAEVAELALTPQDSFLIAATDGLWDRVSNEDAVALVQDTVKHPAMSAQRLALEALARGSGDNIAVVVAFLNSDGSTVERVYTHGQLKYGEAAAAAARRKAAAAAAPSADELRDTY